MDNQFRYDAFVPAEGKDKYKTKVKTENKKIVSSADCYVILTILTTGTDPHRDSLLELSAARYENSIKKASYTTLIRPEDYYLISSQERERKEDYCIVDGGPVCFIDTACTKRTGITNKMLYYAKEELEALNELTEFIADAPLIGYGLSWQIPFLNQMFAKYGKTPLTNDLIDCQDAARRIRKEAGNLTLLDLAVVYEIPYGGLERAETVRNLIVQVYQQLHQEGAFEQDQSLQDKVCVFTGTLQNMVRTEAMRIVRECGGIPGTSVTKKTDYLILGSKEYEARKRGIKSTKLLKAERMIREGASLQIISEETFYQMTREKRKSWN